VDFNDCFRGFNMGWLFMMDLRDYFWRFSVNWLLMVGNLSDWLWCFNVNRGWLYVVDLWFLFLLLSMCGLRLMVRL